MALPCGAKGRLPAGPRLLSDYRKETIVTLLSRRRFLVAITRLGLASFVFPLSVAADPDCRAPHPLTRPDGVFRGRCPNCGMGRERWARTWKTFQLAGRRQEACSFHCLADMALKSGEKPREVMTALFLEPRGMVPARSAWYVVGSSAAGTMTMVSKTAFATRSAAEIFARACGGDMRDYEGTYRLALKGIATENAAIDRKRLAAGKIVPPADRKDECVVCRMYPSRYPRHRAQIRHDDGRVSHFCSTHCLFIWLGGGTGGTRRRSASAMLWVTDFVSGRWISGRTAYYVIDSGYAGPMGSEAVAFDLRARARAFARQHGGRVLIFERVKTGPAAWNG